MNNNYIVYMHMNNVNGKYYIGLTNNPKRRWTQAKYKDSPLFYKAIQKYGWDNFEHIVLFDGLTASQAEQKEMEMISRYNSNNREYGYNITSGGDGARGISHTDETKNYLREKSKGNTNALGYKHTQQALANMSALNKGRPMRDSTKQALIKANTGRIMPDHVRDALIRANTGIQRTEEQRQKARERQIGKKISEATREKMILTNGKRRKVMQLDKHTLKLINTYASLASASRELSIAKSSISMCCAGTIKSAGGFIWKYADNGEDFNDCTTAAPDKGNIYD